MDGGPWTLDPGRWTLDLIDRSMGKVVALRLEVQSAEGLLVLRHVLAEHVQQRLGLLRAQEYGLVIANRHLVGALARGQAEGELKVPYAHAHLHAVGVGLAVVCGLHEVHFWLLGGWTHDGTRLLPQAAGGGCSLRRGVQCSILLSWQP